MLAQLWERMGEAGIGGDCRRGALGPSRKQKRWRFCILVTATYVGPERSQLACVSVLGEGQPIKISEKIKCLLISLQVLSKKKCQEVWEYSYLPFVSKSRSRAGCLSAVFVEDLGGSVYLQTQACSSFFGAQHTLHRHSQPAVWSLTFMAIGTFEQLNGYRIKGHVLQFFPFRKIR